MKGVAPGAEITITVAPARKGKPVGTMSSIILANGFPSTIRAGFMH